MDLPVTAEERQSVLLPVIQLNLSAYARLAG